MTDTEKMIIARELKATPSINLVIKKYIGEVIAGRMKRETFDGIIEYWKKVHLKVEPKTQEEVVVTADYIDQNFKASGQPRKVGFGPDSREGKLLALLSDGKPHHSYELNQTVGWDWRKPLSNLRKEFQIKDEPAGKYKNYQMVI